jgi:hypothetical protein
VNATIKLDAKIKEHMFEKLRKIGISFTTRESLEKDSFEEAHQALAGLYREKYINSVAGMKK